MSPCCVFICSDPVFLISGWSHEGFSYLVNHMFWSCCVVVRRLQFRQSHKSSKSNAWNCANFRTTFTFVPVYLKKKKKLNWLVLADGMLQSRSLKHRKLTWGRSLFAAYFSMSGVLALHAEVTSCNLHWVGPEFPNFHTLYCQKKGKNFSEASGDAQNIFPWMSVIFVYPSRGVNGCCFVCGHSERRLALQFRPIARSAGMHARRQGSTPLVKAPVPYWVSWRRVVFGHETNVCGLIEAKAVFLLAVERWQMWAWPCRMFCRCPLWRPSCWSVFFVI